MLAFADDAALARLVIATWARDCARPARDCRRWRTQDRGRTGEDHRGRTAGARGGPGLSARNSLILKCAATSRPSGEWKDDDFDVLADGAVVGRIMKATAAGPHPRRIVCAADPEARRTEAI